MAAEPKVRIFVDFESGAPSILLWLDHDEVDKVSLGELKARIAAQARKNVSELVITLANHEEPISDSWVGTDICLEEDTRLMVRDTATSAATPSASTTGGSAGEMTAAERDAADPRLHIVVPGSDSGAGDSRGTNNSNSHNHRGDGGDNTAGNIDDNGDDNEDDDGRASDDDSLGGTRVRVHGGYGGTGASERSAVRVDTSSYSQALLEEQQVRFTQVERALIWRIALRDAFDHAVVEGEMAVPMARLRASLFSAQGMLRLIPIEAERAQVADTIIAGMADHTVNSAATWEGVATFLRQWEREDPTHLTVSEGYQEALAPPPEEVVHMFSPGSSNAQAELVLRAGMEAEDVARELIMTEHLRLHAGDEDVLAWQMRELLLGVHQSELRHQRRSWESFKHLTAVAERLLLNYEEEALKYEEAQATAENSLRAALRRSTDTSAAMQLGMLGKVSGGGTVVAKLGKQILDSKLRQQNLQKRIDALVAEGDLATNDRAGSSRRGPGAALSTPSSSSGAGAGRTANGGGSGRGLGSASTAADDADIWGRSAEQEFGSADADGDGELTMDEFSSWASEKLRMIRGAEEHRKSLMAENRRLRQAIELQPQSARFEKRLREWESTHRNMSEELHALQKSHKQLEHDLKVVYSRIEAARADESSRVMDTASSGDIRSALSTLSPHPDADLEGRTTTPMTVQSNATLDLMDKFWLSLDHEQLLQRWTAEMDQERRKISAAKKEWEKEIALLSDRVETLIEAS